MGVVRLSLLLRMGTALAWAPVAISQTASEDLITVNIADKGLAKKLTIESARVIPRGATRLAEISLANGSGSAVNIQYRAEWRDAEGVSIESDSRWEPRTVDSGVSATIQLTGRSMDARSVVLVVKPG